PRGGRRELSFGQIGNGHGFGPLLCSEAATDCSYISSTFYGSGLTEILAPLALTLNAMSIARRAGVALRPPRKGQAKARPPWAARWRRPAAATTPHGS